MKNYSEINKLCKKGQIVFFGSTLFANTNLNELFEDIENKKIYNRSEENLKLDSAYDFFKDSISELEPSKIFINFSTEDLTNELKNPANFIEKYEWLLYQIHQNCKNCKINIVLDYCQENENHELHNFLEKFSKEVGCDFIYIPTNKIEDFSNFLKPHIRNFPINFSDAMYYEN